MSARTSIKQGKSSLIGGIAVGITVLVLWTAIAHELAADGTITIALGVVVAAAVATWIRLADL
jgi:hypothetical protein